MYQQKKQCNFLNILEKFFTQIARPQWNENLKPAIEAGFNGRNINIIFARNSSSLMAKFINIFNFVSHIFNFLDTII